MSKLTLPKNPTLKDFQDYVKQMEKDRGFDHENVLQKCLLLGEEIGELFKAARKQENIGVDVNSTESSIADELADILFYICAIANGCEVNMEKAFRDKEEVNKKRIWK